MIQGLSEQIVQLIAKMHSRDSFVLNFVNFIKVVFESLNALMPWKKQSLDDIIETVILCVTPFAEEFV